MRKALILIGLVGGLLAAAPASAAIREVPQDFPTIQDAVDAANPGDTIAISKKRNNEGVDVSTNNLLIKGVKPGVIVDSYENGSGNDYNFDISSANVRIVNLVLRNGDGITCTDDGCVAKKVRWIGDNETDCFVATGDRARVIGSSLRNCESEGIDISGDDAKVRGSSVRRAGEGCLELTGDDAVIIKSTFASCEDDDAISVSGDRALIEDNRTIRANGYGVDIASGDGGRVLGNRVDAASSYCFQVNSDRAKVRNNVGMSCGSDGMDVTGEDQKVTGNRMVGADDYGFYLSCSNNCTAMEFTDNTVIGLVEDDYGVYFSLTAAEGLLIARNRVTDTTDYGLYLPDVENSRISNNVVTGAGNESEEAIYLSSGEGNTLVGNKALNNGGDGFSINDEDNVLEDNLARGNGGDGFYLDASDLILRQNVAIGNGADGIENDGSDTVLRKNRASGNHRDCANDGTIATKQGNKCADGSNFNLPGTASRIGR